MIIRGTPKNITNYIKVSSKYVMTKLQEMGYFPEYIDNKFAYFKIDLKLVNTLVEIIDEVGENNE